MLHKLREPARESLGDDGDVVERKCHDCGTVSPKTQSVHTLIGPDHGWRIRRVRDGEAHRFEWRCRGCWAALNARSEPRR